MEYSFYVRILIQEVWRLIRQCGLLGKRIEKLINGKFLFLATEKESNAIRIIIDGNVVHGVSIDVDSVKLWSIENLVGIGKNINDK